VRALDRLNLTVPTGCVFGLLGPNGSGKTTTLRIALGIIPPDAGTVSVLGSEDPLSVRHDVGYLPEERGLYAKMGVQEQLAFLGTIRGLTRRQADTMARDWLERLGLSDRSRAHTNELSKGMQQKIQFASAIMHEPHLLVLDEPFSGLDPVNSRLLKELVIEQRRRGATIIFSTHRMEEVEAMCDEICLIHRGRPVLAGKLSEIKASYGRNTLRIEYEGEPGDLASIAGIAEVVDSGRTARLRLAVHADPQSVLRALIERVRLNSFNLEEPHLEEIFIEKVGAEAPALKEEGVVG